MRFGLETLPYPSNLAGRATIILAFVCPFATAVAQTAAPMVTDRPDQTESAKVVPIKTVQVELGALISNAASASGDRQTVSLLPALVRVGILQALEARVGFAGWMRASTTAGGASSTESGFGSLEMGFKVRVANGNSLAPAVAVLGAAVLPTGAAAFRTERVDAAVRVAVSHDLSDRIGLGYNVGFRTFSFATGTSDVTTEIEGIYTASLGIAIARGVGAFVEVFGAAAISDAAASRHLVDGGLTFSLINNLQLDLSAGLGYAGNADDWFAGAGVSFRLPR